MARKRLSR